MAWLTRVSNWSKAALLQATEGKMKSSILEDLSLPARGCSLISVLVYELIKLYYYSLMRKKYLRQPRPQRRRTSNYRPSYRRTK